MICARDSCNEQSIIYRRVTDANGGLIDHGKRTHFEAGFHRVNHDIVLLSARVVDSAEREIVRSGNPFDALAHLESKPDLAMRYKNRNIAQQLQDAIHSIDSEDITLEPASIQSPLSEITFEIQGPMIIKDAFKVTLSMSLGFYILDQHQWLDSSYISFGMLCNKVMLLQFLNDLSSDLSCIADSHISDN